MKTDQVLHKFSAWRKDWNLFASQVLQVYLDPEQQSILSSVQNNPMTSVVSGTSRGKDFVAAVAAICFLYLTPKWNDKGELIENTKVAMTAPTGRQIENIMFPEISRIFNRVGFLPGRLTGHDIRTENDEWFLTGFKADNTNTEAWTGFHAVHTMFIVTEASGLPQKVYDAIEGNLQGDSRLLIVFNANSSIGYAAASQKSKRWQKFRLDSLTAPNVIHKRMIIPGQVDYEWIKDKVANWCVAITAEEFNEGEGDFEFENVLYRPNDLFRVKVRGLFPKTSEDILIPLYWIQLANERWKQQQIQQWKITKPLRLGVDVAGMGRDSSGFCYRFDNYVQQFEMIQSGGVANHMEIAGKTVNILKAHTDDFIGVKCKAFIDTIGEGAGVYSRVIELSNLPATAKNAKPEYGFLKDNVYSCKYSESAQYNGKVLKDVTGIYEFLNMRAYLYWAIRDWLDPKNKMNAMLPPDDALAEELTETRYVFLSTGKIKIEAKEEIKERLGRSPDKADSLANTFYPASDFILAASKRNNFKNFAGAFR